MRLRLPRQFQSLQLRYHQSRLLFRMVRELVMSGSVVWDVGANVGLFSFSEAALAGPGFVLAIEPHVWLAHLLVRSAQRNSTPPEVHLWRCLVPAHQSKPHLPAADCGERARSELSERSERIESGRRSPLSAANGDRLTGFPTGLLEGAILAICGDAHHCTHARGAVIAVVFEGSYPI